MTPTQKAAMQAAIKALEQLDGIDTETEIVTICVSDEIEGLRAALAETEQDSNAYREAKYLAEALFKKYYAHDECYASGRVTWGVCDSTAGIISQIDNMVSTLVREPGEHTGGAA